MPHALAVASFLGVSTLLAAPSTPGAGLPADKIILASVGKEEIVLARDGSPHAAFVARVGTRQQVMTELGAGEIFDEVDPNRLIVLEGGDALYGARLATSHFLIWPGGKSPALASPPRILASPDGKNWMATGVLPNGQQLGFINGRTVGPFQSIVLESGFAESPMSQFNLWAHDADNRKTGGEYFSLNQSLRFTSDMRGKLETPDGFNLLLSNGAEIWVNGVKKNLRRSDKGTVRAAMGPGGAVAALVTDEFEARGLARNRKREARFFFTGGFELKLADNAHFDVQKWAFKQDGTDFIAVTSQATMDGQRSLGIVTKAGWMHGSQFSAIMSPRFIGGKPFFVGARTDARHCLVWNDWISEEFEADRRSDADPFVVSADGAHFAAVLGTWDRPALGLDREQFPLDGKVDRRSLQISENGAVAAVVVDKGGTGICIVRLRSGGMPIETPIARAMARSQPVLTADGQRCAIAYARGPNFNVQLDGEDVLAEAATGIVYFSAAGLVHERSAEFKSSEYMNRGARCLFFSPDSRHLAFFSGTPKSATLQFDGQASGPYEVLTEPRFGSDGRVVFLARVGEDVARVEVAPGEARQAPVASRTPAEPGPRPAGPAGVPPGNGGLVPAEPAPATRQPARVTGDFAAKSSSTEIARVGELRNGLLLFTEGTSRLLVAHARGPIGQPARGDGGIRPEVTLEFDGRRISKGTQFGAAAASADGSRIAFEASDDGGTTTCFMVDGKRFGGEAVGDRVATGAFNRNGTSFAYWSVSRNGNGSTVSLWHDGRKVFSKDCQIRFEPRREQQLPWPVISDDGRRVAAFIRLPSGPGRESNLLVVDGAAYELPRPAYTRGAPFGAFVGADQRFETVVDTGAKRMLWRENEGLSREFSQSQAMPALAAANGRVAIPAAGLHDSGALVGIEEPSVRGTVTAGPVLSPDGRRIAAALEPGAGMLPSMWVDGEKVADGRRFCEPAFSRDSKRLIFGYESHDPATFLPGDGDFNRGIGRLTIDGSQFDVDAIPEKVGFSPDGQHAWAVTGVNRQSGREYRAVINGAPGPKFAFVDDVVFSPDGLAAAYIAKEIDRYALVVNHKVVARFDKLIEANDRINTRMFPGLTRRSLPFFTGNRTVSVHGIDGDMIKRFDVALEGALPALPSIEDARKLAAAPQVKRPAFGEEPEEPAKEEDGSGDEEAERQPTGWEKELVDEMRKGLEGLEGLIPGGRAPAEAAPKKREQPGKPAKSADSARFHGVWKVRYPIAGGEAKQDVITVNKDGTMTSDQAIELDLGEANYQVRSIGSRVILIARVEENGVSLDWTLEIKGSELDATVVETIGKREQSISGKGTR